MRGERASAVLYKKIEASAVEIPYTALNEKRERLSTCENETRDLKERIEKKKKQKKKKKTKQKKKKKKKKKQKKKKK